MAQQQLTSSRVGVLGATYSSLPCPCAPPRPPLQVCAIIFVPDAMSAGVGIKNLILIAFANFSAAAFLVQVLLYTLRGSLRARRLVDSAYRCGRVRQGSGERTVQQHRKTRHADACLPAPLRCPCSLPNPPHPSIHHHSPPTHPYHPMRCRVLDYTLGYFLFAFLFLLSFLFIIDKIQVRLLGGAAGRGWAVSVGCAAGSGGAVLSCRHAAEPPQAPKHKD